MSAPDVVHTPFRLRTLGGLALTSSDGQTIAGEHGQQRRRLALLAILAAAGDRGRTRDQLLLLLWPDASQSRARHSLEQLLYAIRNSIDERIFSGTNPVRLNPELVSSDVTQFTRAIEAGELEAAARAYQGPFLDGFYLSEAPEFEQWMSDERARLARSHAAALEQLAERASAASEYATAVRWWTQLSEADAVSSRAAAGLARALADNGDHAAALRHLEQYERRIARELGAKPGPEIAELLSEIHARGGDPSARVPHPRQDPAPGSSPPAPMPARPGAPSEPPSARRPERHRPRVTRVAVAATAIAVVALSASVFTRQRTPQPGADDTRISIAVLPLANLSGSPADVPVVDGITEELIGVLSRIGQLRVVARTSAFVFRDSNLDVRRIADSLRVAHVLEGSVQRSNDRIRVQVRLVDARDGSTRWAESYDRALEDLLEVQSDIAAAVARELDLRLNPRTAAAVRRPVTQNVAAYELYLRGRDPIHFRTVTGRRTGLALLQQAVALDSNFAAAYANMAYMHAMPPPGSGGVYVTATQRAESARLRFWAANKALSLDPNLSEGYAALGLAHGMNGDLRSAELAFKRALSLPGYSRAREHLARIYLWQGRLADGLAENFRALEDDPLSPTATADVGHALCLNGRTEEGLAQLARIADLDPPLQRRAGYVTVCHLVAGSWERAAEVARQRPGSTAQAHLGYALARSGQLDSARVVRARLVQQALTEEDAILGVAMVSVALRDYDEAFRWLDRAPVNFGLYEIMSPLFADLHADPRFERTRRRILGQNR